MRRFQRILPEIRWHAGDCNASQHGEYSGIRERWACLQRHDHSSGGPDDQHADIHGNSKHDRNTVSDDLRSGHITHGKCRERDTHAFIYAGWNDLHADRDTFRRSGGALSKSTLVQAVMAINFKPTSDRELIRKVMTNDSVYPYISDDASLPVELFQPIFASGVLYLLCYDDFTLLGLWMFVQTNAAMVEVHTCLLPGHGYRRAREAAKLAAEWIWENTACQRIWTQVPQNNRIALNFAKAAGMEECGMQPNSFLKCGKLYSLIQLGVSRPKENDVKSCSNSHAEALCAGRI